MEVQTLIGIAQMKISQDPGEILIAPNLGSCVAVGVYDYAKKFGGLIHCLLPMSKSDPQKAAENPYMYVDTGVAMMLDQMFHMGADRKTMIITVGGGSNINDQNNVFEIGKKNYTVLKKFLWKNNLLIKAEHVGDNFSRTVSLHIASGQSYVKVQGQIFELA